MCQVNCMWLNDCKRGEHDTYKYFEKFEDTQSIAEPKFKIPPELKLSSTCAAGFKGVIYYCKWGIIYKKIEHVKSNWLNSKFVGETREIMRNFEPQFSPQDVAICSDRIMAPRPHQPPQKYGIWDFKNNLEDPIQNIDGSLSTFPIKNCRMNDKFMFFTQHLLLQVYKREGEFYTYAFKCPFHKEAAVCGPDSIFKKENDGFEEAYFKFFGGIKKERFIDPIVLFVKHYFIALLQISEPNKGRNATLHGWDLSNQTKVFELPIQCIVKKKLFGICSSTTNDNTIIYYATGDISTDIYKLDLTNYSCINLFHIRRTYSSCLFEGNVLAIHEGVNRPKDRLSIHSTDTSGLNVKALTSHEFADAIVNYSVQIRGENIGMCTGGKVEVRKVSDLRVIVFEYEYQDETVKHDTGIDYRFGVFNLILLADPNKLPKKIQVWNLTTHAFIKELMRSDHIFSCVLPQHLFIYVKDSDEENSEFHSIKCVHFW